MNSQLSKTLILRLLRDQTYKVQKCIAFRNDFLSLATKGTTAANSVKQTVFFFQENYCHGRQQFEGELS